MDGLKLAMTLAGSAHHVNVEEENSYWINAGTFWTDITFHPGQENEVKADGLPNDQGATLIQALNAGLKEKRLRDEAKFLQREHQKIQHWLDHKAGQERKCAKDRRWFTHEQQQEVLAARPNVNVADLRNDSATLMSRPIWGLSRIW